MNTFIYDSRFSEEGKKTLREQEQKALQQF